jgi:hypothetical protein
MEQRGDRVLTTLPVLVSHEETIPAGSHLHNIYIIPDIDEPDANILSLLQKDTRREAAYTRKPQHVNKQSSALHYYEKSLESMRSQRWKKIQLFQLAFANLAHKSMHIVYTAPGDRRVSESVIDLPNGLLIAEKGQALVILAVQVGSRAEQAGITSGDIIRSVNNITTSTLASVSKAWNGQSNQFSLQKAGGASRLITLKPPVSMNTSVFDMP